MVYNALYNLIFSATSLQPSHTLLLSILCGKCPKWPHLRTFALTIPFAHSAFFSRQPQVLLHHFPKVSSLPSLAAPFLPSLSPLSWLIFIYSICLPRGWYGFVFFIVCLSPQECKLPKGGCRAVLPPLYSWYLEKCPPCNGNLITH